MDTYEMRKLRQRAKQCGMSIRKDQTTGGYWLIDINSNAVVTGPALLGDIEARIAWGEANADE